MQNFHIFTMVWSAYHVDLFKRACFRSLNWPKNVESLQGRDWYVYTKREHEAEIVQLFEGRPFNLKLIFIEDSIRVAGCGFIKTSQCDNGVLLLDGLRKQIYHSISNKSKLLLAPPDTIFGDGTISNLISIGAQPGTCVSVCHSRVLPEIIEDLEYLVSTRGAINNANLVTMAFKHAHKSWSFAEVGHEKNNSFIGGISWKELSTGLYSVCHRLPTVYFADFLENDWDFFWSQVSFGGWDHRWPAENLIRQERQRIVGSSDACMIVEITEADKNVPPDPNPEILKRILANGESDAFWNSHYHNGINRQTSVVFRGE